MPSFAVSLADYKAGDKKKRKDGVCTLKGWRLILPISLSVLGEEVAHLHTTPLGGDTGKLFALDIQRRGRKEVTNVQQWLLWLRWAAIAMEVEIHRETQKLLTASQYSFHNIHPDSREGPNLDLNMKNCYCQAHTTWTSLERHITSLRHTVLFYCSFSWPRFQEWACAVQASSPSPQRYHPHRPARHNQLCISGHLRIPAGLPCTCICSEVKLISPPEQRDSWDSFFQ